MRLELQMRGFILLDSLKHTAGGFMINDGIK
jgi:hypothetical protein